MEGFCFPKVNLYNIYQARIVDVKGALDEIPVTAEGQLIIKINDKQCEWNNTTFEITSNGKHLTVASKKEAETSLKVTIEGLSALLYGTLAVRDLEVFNWIKGAKEEQLVLLEKWFPKKTPWMMEHF